MKVLNILIKQMNKEEARHLKLFLNRTSSKGDRKDVQLFDYIRKSKDEYKEEKVVAKLYGEADKNAFYRLKNRLTEDINKSLLLQYFGHQDNNVVLHFIALSRHFVHKRNYDLASRYLVKAERKASQILSYELLDVIYSDFIKLSHESLTVNPEEHIEKRKQNREKLKRVQEIDDVLAALIYRIKVSANYSKQNVGVMTLLQKTVSEFSNDPTLRESPVLRFKIYHALSRILLQQHNYEALEEYLIKTFDEFTEEKLFNKNNHDTKLQMLTYLANCQFKNGKFEEALTCCERLKAAMEEFGGHLHDKYAMYYYNALVNNYTQFDREKALEIIEEASQNSVIRSTPLFSVIIKGQQAQIYFDVRSYKQASRSLVRMKLDDGYPSLDEGFKLKINVAELMIRYELGDADSLEYLIGQVRKEFSALLQDENYKRQRDLMDIIEQMIFTSSISRDAALVEKVKSILNSISDEASADADWVSYNNWLRPKIS
jgi:tetratricopeptide (TPR) repeat protein